MVMKVYGDMISTAATRILLCLNEKSLEYDFVLVDLRARQQKKAPYLSLHPFGQVPVFEDGDIKLFESRAITRYIAHAYAEKGTPLVFNDQKEMAEAEVWAEVEAQRFEPPASMLTWEFGIKPLIGLALDEAVVAEQQAELAKVLDVYEARLAHSKYLGGAAFSLVDLHHISNMKYLMATPVKAIFDARPRVSAWAADIMARPSWQKVLAFEKNLKGDH